MSLPSQTLHLTPEEMAARLGVTVRTLSNQRCAGRGPPWIRWGARILYPVQPAAVGDPPTVSSGPRPELAAALDTAVAKAREVWREALSAHELAAHMLRDLRTSPYTSLSAPEVSSLRGRSAACLLPKLPELRMS